MIETKKRGEEGLTEAAHTLVDMPASAQMTESPINTNTKSGGMRVEGRVTHPPKSTPDRKSTRLNSSHERRSRMPSSA